MGTKNLTCVYCNGAYRVAQYGQWDGYPDGQGITALTFLRDKMNIEEFTRKIMLCKALTKDELTAICRWQELGDRASPTVARHGRGGVAGNPGQR